jgi:exosortase/archaeosortase family protein
LELPSVSAFKWLSFFKTNSRGRALAFVLKVSISYLVILEWIYPKYILNSIVNKALCFGIALISTGLLKLSSFDASLQKVLISVNGHPAVYVCTPCSGLDFIILFAIITFSFPVEMKERARFFVIGATTIMLLNFVRVMCLALIHRYFHTFFDINHHLVFNVIAYGCIFIMWILWARKKEVL